MNKILLFICFLYTYTLSAQDSQMALRYFQSGDFEKALVLYEQLLDKNDGNPQVYQKVLVCYQELQQYAKAQQLIKNRINKYKIAALDVDLGYNFQLQQKNSEAVQQYEKALKSIDIQPHLVYQIAKEFEDKVLLDYAIKAYELAVLKNDQFNFDYQLSLLYGQQGKMEIMVEKLLNYVERNKTNEFGVQNLLVRYLQEDADLKFAGILRKALLNKSQQTQDVFWNGFLSWFFVQQKEYGKAFIQEKAIFRRNGDNLRKIISLGRATMTDKDWEQTAEILTFASENTQDKNLILEIQYLKNEVDIKLATAANQKAVQAQLNAFLDHYDYSNATLDLALQTASFEAFVIKDYTAAEKKFKQLQQLNLNIYEGAKLKDLMADVFLMQEKFNQSILLYAQIEDALKNHEFAHEATFKLAKASYYKGDFEWAQKQFKVLKQATSQLIANDALELFLLINDATVADSTQQSLKKFARADFLIYQNKKAEALTVLKELLLEHKEEQIADATLLRLGELQQDLGNYQEALVYFNRIIQEHKESIYRDEAFFYSAEIYRLHLQQEDLAKQQYEQIIFHHADSIHFVEAQTQYRRLRGDKNL
ncbi:MAG: tetratricopeptide repeat protein [Flavobacterium sp.]|nr:tetratricopeptide repeat protein [Candidatus Neoflavobacterium equi]